MRYYVKYSTAPIKLKPIRKYTLPIFLERAQLIHGDKFDYSKITPEHVKSYYSEVTITCKTCGYQWTTSIASHINQRCGCPSCSGVVKWTLERFLIQALQIHGDKFDYSQVKVEHIQGAHSHIPLICNTCGHQWSPAITHHITSQNGCPDCYGTSPWTFTRFLIKAKEIHGDKYNYNDITPNMIQNEKSKIPIICNGCYHHWTPSINNHINNETGCPECYGNIAWTLERFIIRSREIHGDKFDYSHITQNHIQNKDSKVPIICKICGYFWTPSIDCHINSKSGCLECSGKAPWTLERFLTKAEEIHGNKYDYSQITDEHIQGYQANVPVTCQKCRHHWNPRIENHITGKTGCPSCASRFGFSDAQMRWLESIMESENILIQHALSPSGEYKIPGVGKVDGFCQETNTVYEFHGDFWHGNPNKFNSHDTNPVSGKNYGELYQKTLERDQRIRDMGYNLVTKWETDIQ